MLRSAATDAGCRLEMAALLVRCREAHVKREETQCAQKEVQRFSRPLYGRNSGQHEAWI